MSADGNILVHVEIDGSQPHATAFELISAARELATARGVAVEALVASADPKAFFPALAAADRVIAVAHPALDGYNPEAHLAALRAAAESRRPAVTLFSYSTVGLDLASALACATGSPIVDYCTKLVSSDGGIQAESHLHGGKLRAISLAPLPAIFTIMPGSHQEASAEGRPAPEVVKIEAPDLFSRLGMTVIGRQGPDTGGFDLADAERIACVGRGIGDKDGVEGVRKIAELLGAEIAGSRPVIDLGLLPKERQIGKSGRKVKPKLYLSFGVSGAPEHLEGMREADLIIAVNSDPRAPIFEAAHYGAACDALDLLPALAERLKKSG
jgi:electron transfer flavoprotein alpha subunit